MSEHMTSKQGVCKHSPDGEHWVRVRLLREGEEPQCEHCGLIVRLFTKPRLDLVERARCQWTYETPQGELALDLCDEFEKQAQDLEHLHEDLRISQEELGFRLAERDRLRAALNEVRIERNYLRGSLEAIASGSLDDMPPFRAAPHDVLRKFAQKTLDWPRAPDTSGESHG